LTFSGTVATASAVTPAAPAAAVTCDPGSATVYFIDTAQLRNGYYSDAKFLAWVGRGTTASYSEWCKNKYGNVWYHLKKTTSRPAGWVYEGYVRRI
jgi:hypothetical protein